MTFIPILPQTKVNELYNNIQDNVDSYSKNEWQRILSDQIKELKSTRIPSDLGELLVKDQSLREGKIDAINSEIIFKNTEGLTPYQARDERIITAISHMHMGGYAFFRHKKMNDKNNIDEIKKRYFARGGQRNIERDNVFSSLWWNAYFIDRCKEGYDRSELLEALCTDTDFRSQLVERPTLSKVPQVALAILLCKIKLIDEDHETNFFSRRTNSSYRKWFRLIDFYGGTHLYAAMSTKNLHELFWRLLIEVRDE